MDDDRRALLAERERIAAELHERTIKTFFGISLQLNGIANRVSDPEIGQLLEECTRRLDAGISELRRLAFDLRTPP
jgi:signal transduction histidine kinase